MNLRTFLLVSSLLLACEEYEPRPHYMSEDFGLDQVWTSAHFRYASRSKDRSICNGVMKNIELHFKLIHDYLGLPWNGTPIEYCKFRDYDDLHSSTTCGVTAGGCLAYPGVLAGIPLDPHELIHVYLAPLGYPVPLFDEGIAVALAPGQAPGGKRLEAPSQSWRDIIVQPGDNADGSINLLHYTAGGWFVTYLLKHFGPAAFLDFFKAASGIGVADEIASRFQEVYGASLDDTWNEARTKAPLLAGIPVWECASAVPVVVGGPLVGLTNHCDGLGFIGGLDLAKESVLTWPDNADGVAVSSCSLEVNLRVELSIWAADGAIALPAGQYFIAPGGNLPYGYIGFRDSPAVLGRSCDSIAPLTLTHELGGTGLLAVALTNSTDPWFAKPQLDPPSSLQFGFWAFDPLKEKPTMRATVEACDTCQGPCHPIDSASGWQIQPGMVLRYTNLNGPGGSTATTLAYKDPCLYLPEGSCP